MQRAVHRQDSLLLAGTPQTSVACPTVVERAALMLNARPQLPLQTLVGRPGGRLVFGVRLAVDAADNVRRVSHIWMTQGKRVSTLGANPYTSTTTPVRDTRTPQRVNTASPPHASSLALTFLESLPKGAHDGGHARVVVPPSARIGGPGPRQAAPQGKQAQVPG